MDCICDSKKLQWKGHDFDCEYMMTKRGNQIVDMPVEKLIYDDETNISSEWLDSLQEGIEAVGLLYPIQVKKLGKYYLVKDGIARLLVFQRLKRKTIKAEIGL